MKERLSLSVPVGVVAQVKELAAKDKRNLSNYITVILEDIIKKNKKAANPS